MRYELQPLKPEQAAAWDALIAPYESAQLFHRRAWLDYLAASRGVDVRFWSIDQAGRTIGYFCGGVLRKGPFRILGSPLKGWGSNFMGPVVNADFDQAAFFEALDDLAADERLAMLEIENPVLGGHIAAAFEYEGVAQPTYLVELTPGQTDTMWRRLKSRDQVRKARRNGLTVDDAPDAGFPDEFYNQFVEVLARKGLYPPYDRRCPQLLIEHLAPAGLLFALSVRDQAGNVAATALLPHDGKTMYLWGAGSRIEHWSHCPNDLVQWAAMEMAADRGLRLYNMCGYGYFKSKFGGALAQPVRWHKCFSVSAHLGRRAYQFYFDRRIQARGFCQSAFGGSGAATETRCK